MPLSSPSAVVKTEMQNENDPLAGWDCAMLRRKNIPSSSCMSLNIQYKKVYFVMCAFTLEHIEHIKEKKTLLIPQVSEKNITF